MQKAEVAAGRHQIHDLYDLELLSSQFDPLADLGSLFFVDVRTGVAPTPDDIAHFEDGGHRLAANKMLMPELERQIGRDNPHHDETQVSLAFA